MDNNERAEVICGLFDEMTEVLLETENEVNELYTCSPDDIDVSVERINKYREITDEILAEIDSVCAGEETGELKKATLPLTDRMDVSPDFVEVFEKRQDVNAVICRIQAAIPMVKDRLKKAMEKTLEEIKENNSGQSAKAARYYNAVNDSQNSYNLTKKSRTI